jgi:hypothetical protein
MDSNHDKVIQSHLPSPRCSPRKGTFKDAPKAYIGHLPGEDTKRQEMVSGPQKPRICLVHAQRREYETDDSGQ